MIKAQADLVPDEYNSADNTATYLGTVFVKISGDVDSDGSVNLDDLSTLNQAFGSNRLSANWNSECDFNRDGIINVDHVRLLGEEFRKEN